MKLKTVLISIGIILSIAVGVFLLKYVFNKKISNLLPKERENLTIKITDVSFNVIYPETDMDTNIINLSSYIFQPLVSFDKNNVIASTLSDRWDNPDEYTWRFHLSSKAKFSDGSPVTTEDILYTYNYIKNSSLPMKELIPEATVSVQQNNMIEFKTTKPDPIFLNRLAMNFLVMSEKDIQASGSQSRLGSGPYKFVEIKENEYIKLSRNENYWQKDKPQFKNVTFNFNPVNDSPVDALKNKSIDIALMQGKDNIELLNQAVKQNELQKVIVNRGGSVDYLALDALRDKSPYINTDKNPLKDVRVRKAMYMALDTNQIVNNISSETVGIDQLVPQGIFGYNPSIKRPPYDLSKAKELMKEAGYENGFSIVLDYFDTSKNKEMVSTIPAQFEKIGIIVKLNGVDDMGKFTAKIDARDSSMYRIGYGSDSKDALEVFEFNIHTTNENYGAYNLGYSNQEIDKLIEETANVKDFSIRKTNLNKIMQLTMDDVAVIPLISYNNIYGYSNELLWTPRIDGLIRIENIKLK